MTDAHRPPTSPPEGDREQPAPRGARDHEGPLLQGHTTIGGAPPTHDPASPAHAQSRHEQRSDELPRGAGDSALSATPPKSESRRVDGDEPLHAPRETAVIHGDGIAAGFPKPNRPGEPKSQYIEITGKGIAAAEPETGRKIERDRVAAELSRWLVITFSLSAAAVIVTGLALFIYIAINDSTNLENIVGTLTKWAGTVGTLLAAPIGFVLGHYFKSGD